jgi:spore coat polysaccharide biosynthesis predicted glycosyltransferase SpsG
MVRPEIRRGRQLRAQEPPAPFRALIAMGEDNYQAVFEETLELLLPISRLERIDLAVRPTSPALSILQNLVAVNPNRVELATEPAELTPRLARCHFAITRGDSWSLELACVGVPQLLIVQTEMHWPNARRLEEEGAAICLGDAGKITPANFRKAIQDLLADPFERQAMSRCGRKLIDGRGPDRLVTALEVLLHPSRLVDFQEPESFAA